MLNSIEKTIDFMHFDFTLSLDVPELLKRVQLVSIPDSFYLCASPMMERVLLHAKAKKHKNTDPFRNQKMYCIAKNEMASFSP